MNLSELTQKESLRELEIPGPAPLEPLRELEIPGPGYRNFGYVVSGIIDRLEVRNELAVTEAIIDFIFANSDWSPTIKNEIVQFLRILDQQRMTTEEHHEFVQGLKRIARNSAYVPPEDISILWEKLAKLCAIYLRLYQDFDWTIKISKFIRNK